MLRAGLCFWLVFECMLLRAAELRFDFGAMELNQPPPDFRSSLSGEGKPGDWRIIQTDAPTRFPAFSPKAPSANKETVLAQLAEDPTDEHFPLLVYEKERFGDFKLSTRFKLMAGKEERMAGIAFRLQDERNYYYIRASGPGNSFYFFKVVDGVRSAPIGSKVEISNETWHEMTIECRGNEIRSSLDGKEVLPSLTDRSFLRGKIAFWTKSDSVTYFADTSIQYTPEVPFVQTMLAEVLEQYDRLVALKLFARVPGQDGVRMIASDDPKEVGQAGEQVERDVLERGVMFHGKGRHDVVVTMPVHDRNGDIVAAARVVMKSFPGQTEKNAIERATPVVKEIERRILAVRHWTE